MKESGGNTRLYTFWLTGLVMRESELNEENTKVGDPNYPTDDHSKRLASPIISTSGAKAHASRLASKRDPTPQHLQTLVLSRPMPKSTP